VSQNESVGIDSYRDHFKKEKMDVVEIISKEKPEFTWVLICGVGMVQKVLWALGLMGTALSAQVFVTNGSFERGSIGWSNLAQEGGTAAFSYANTEPQQGVANLKADVQVLGTNPWSIQSIGKSMHLIPGNTYQISFYAKASVASKTLRAVLQNTTFAQKDFPLTTSWAPYSWTFTPTEADLNFKFFYVQTGVFEIDNIQLQLSTVVHTPPSSILIAPHMNAYYQAGSDVILRAYASGIGGSATAKSVAKVEFFQGTTKLGESTVGAQKIYEYKWAKVPAGSYTITARTTDAGGITSTSAGIVIVVGDAPVKPQGMSAGKGKYLANLNGYNRTEFSTYWNGVTAENASKWGSVEGTRDVMNWRYSDSAYNYALRNNQMFRYHAFAWGSQYPSWITTLTPADFQIEMEEYIAAVSERYPYLDQIDVLNEQLFTHAGGTTYFRDGLGGTGVTGYDWQIWLFAKAREYFPNAKLVLNDYGLENDPNAITEQLKLIKVLRDRGLLDGFGTQAHCFNIDGFASDSALLRTRLNTMATGGVPIYVTELDLKGKLTTEASQLESYQKVFPVYWTHPDVAGITLWGYVEGSTWITGSGLLNADGSERSAMVWLKDYMSQQTDVGYPFKIQNQAPTDLVLSANTLAENMPAGTVVGTLSATDADANETFQFTLVTGTGSTHNANFQIVGSQLQSKVSMDYEWASTRSIRVRVTDKGGLYYEKAFTISLTNVEERSIGTLATLLNMQFGTPIISSRWAKLDQREKHLDTIAAHYNMALSESYMRPKYTQPQQGVFVWDKVDSMMQWSESQGMTTRGHFLVWDAPSQNPTWLTDRVWSTSPNRWTREQLLAILKTHIDSVVGHFKGRVLEWDVVNEAVTSSQADGLERSWWYNIIGPDYIDSAFTWAHRADPNAWLYINEYDADKDYSATAVKADTLYSVVKRLVEKGVPVHGVGLQGHMGNWINATTLSSNIARYADLGLRVSLTEVDLMDAANSPSAWGNVAKVAVENYNFTSLVTWGVDDSVSWYGTDCGCLLWDSLGARRTANYDAVRNEFAKGSATVAAQRKTFLERKPWPLLPSELTLSDSIVPENELSYVVGILKGKGTGTGRFSFQLVAGAGSTDNAKFQIVGDTLKAILPLDYEYAPTRSVRIRMTETMGLSIEKTFVIHLTDVPETPVFVPENGATQAPKKKESKSTFDLLGRKNEYHKKHDIPR